MPIDSPKRKRRKRNRNHAFLNALGQHCQRLRSQRGMSIDRLSKESDGLSSSVIHRLETGLGAVTITALYRYACALNLPLRTLLEFEVPQEPKQEGQRKRADWIAPDDPRVKSEAFVSLLPVYSLKAAAGYFGQSEDVRPEGWVEAGHRGKLDRRMFVARAVGNSMAPRIKDGDLLIFRASPTGSRQGKILLVQYRGPEDPETGGSYTVKEYRSSKKITSDGSWYHQQITLNPLNPEYEPIVLSPKRETDFRVIAEYLFTLHRP